MKTIDYQYPLSQSVNNQRKFLKNNLSLPVCRRASYMAVDHYRRSSQASRKGRMFDDCLHIAKVWANKFAKDMIKIFISSALLFRHIL
ncbi:hypothetical protein WMR86_07580 [Proteus vulgaris]|uniref:hypothetical protein n=1 Tax=Proteus TaxID=583 RepID=UPI001AA17295